MRSLWLPRVWPARPFFALVQRAKPLSRLRIDGEGRRDSFRFGSVDGGSVERAWLVGAVVAEQRVDAVGEVGGDGAGCLVVVAASLDHQAAVEIGELRVVLASGVGRARP